MESRRTLTLGQKGAKKLPEHYGEQLISCLLSLCRAAAQTRRLCRNHHRMNPAGLRM
jgi:hypothetical protein